VVGPTFGFLPWGSGFRDFGEQGAATSSTAALLSGAIAILMTQFPDADNSVLRAALRAGASNVQVGRPFLLYDRMTGSGLLQIRRSLGAVKVAQLHYSYLMEKSLGGFLPPPPALLKVR